LGSDRFLSTVLPAALVLKHFASYRQNTNIPRKFQLSWDFRTFISLINTLKETRQAELDMGTYFCKIKWYQHLA